MRRKNIPVLAVFYCWIITACLLAQTPPNTTVASMPPEESGVSSTSTVDLNNLPKFVNSDFVDLGQIRQISLFRSGEGHDYSDDVETCRSMKHYYRPLDDLDWSAIKIYSPVEGEVTACIDEWAGMQIHIRSTRRPEFTFILFHVNANQEIGVGYHAAAGMEIGAHIGNMTFLDIAVRMNTPGSYRLVSYFDVMTDELFKEYTDRGVPDRSALILAREQRDADPLVCDGETITGQGSLPDWFILE